MSHSALEMLEQAFSENDYRSLSQGFLFLLDAAVFLSDQQAGGKLWELKSILKLTRLRKTGVDWVDGLVRGCLFSSLFT